MTKADFIEIIRKMHDHLVAYQDHIVLVCDNFEGHEIDYNSCPRRTTTKVQPLDQGVIETFKIHYVAQLMGHIYNFYNENKSLKGVEKSFNLYYAAFWIEKKLGLNLPTYMDIILLLVFRKCA